MKRPCGFFVFVFHTDSASHEISSVRSLDVCGTLLAGFMPELISGSCRKTCGKTSCRNMPEQT